MDSYDSASWRSVISRVRQSVEHVTLPFPQRQDLTYHFGGQEVIGPDDKVFLLNLYEYQQHLFNGDLWMRTEIRLYHVIPHTQSQCRLLFWIRIRVPHPQNPYVARLTSDAWISGPVDRMVDALLSNSLFSGMFIPAPGLTAGGRWLTAHPYYAAHRAGFLSRTNQELASLLPILGSPIPPAAGRAI
jgi:hypothetical protein